ncbi:MAG TPA: MurR/RpiR family transcriptional regulator [Thermotogota bacterium]|nr:MurR/RpiR family transcriptional regulator [Thermotogota bacterium]
MIQKLLEQIPTMTPVNQKIGNYILDHKSEVGFMTIAQLSEKVDVSKASIVRFARQLDFEGFNEFKKVIQQEIRQELSPYEKIKFTTLDSATREDQFKRLANNELKNVESTIHKIKPKEIFKVVNKLEHAQKLFISGFGMSTNLARMMEYSLLSVTDKPVFVLSGSVSDFALETNRMTEHDVLFLITFPVYSREIKYVAAMAKQRSTPICLLTDSLTCPICKTASSIILCATDSLLRINSYAAPLAVIHIMTNLLILNNKEKAENNVKKVMEIEKEGNQNLDCF